MPSEQPPAHNPGSTRQEPAEQRQHPPSRGGVRMLLGLPFSDRGASSTAALTAPPGRQHYGQSPLPEPEESDESFDETASDAGVIAEAREARATYTEPPTEQREQTHLVIPGVSTHRTAFPTLSQTADTPTLSMEGEPRHAIPPQAAPLSAPVSLSGARDMSRSDVELLTRLEQLVTEGARAQQSSEAQARASAPLSPGPLETMGLHNGEPGDQDLAQRVEQLQRTVRDLAATVSSQMARNSDESQAQRRELHTPPLQRTVIIKRSDAPSTTPRAFWERSRLGRFCLRTGR